MGLDGNVGEVGPVNAVFRVVFGRQPLSRGKMLYTVGCQRSVCPLDTVNTGGWRETLSRAVQTYVKDDRWSRTREGYQVG